jgi:hypothetical protein
LDGYSAAQPRFRKAEAFGETTSAAAPYYRTRSGGRRMNAREIGKALGASTSVKLPRPPRDALDALLLVRLLHEQLQPGAGRRPGRPTNPAWTMRRQVPFRPETWERLDRYAASLSTPQRQVSPAQLAATILEQVLGAVDEPAGADPVSGPEPDRVEAPGNR